MHYRCLIFVILMSISGHIYGMTPDEKAAQKALNEFKFHLSRANFITWWQAYEKIKNPNVEWKKKWLEAVTKALTQEWLPFNLRNPMIKNTVSLLKELGKDQGEKFLKLLQQEFQVTASDFLREDLGQYAMLLDTYFDNLSDLDLRLPNIGNEKLRLLIELSNKHLEQNNAAKVQELWKKIMDLKERLGPTYQYESGVNQQLTALELAKRKLSKPGAPQPKITTKPAAKPAPKKPGQRPLPAIEDSLKESLQRLTSRLADLTAALSTSLG